MSWSACFIIPTNLASQGVLIAMFISLHYKKCHNQGNIIPCFPMACPLY